MKLVEQEQKPVAIVNKCTAFLGTQLVEAQLYRERERAPETHVIAPLEQETRASRLLSFSDDADADDDDDEQE